MHINSLCFKGKGYRVRWSGRTLLNIDSSTLLGLVPICGWPDDVDLRCCKAKNSAFTGLLRSYEAAIMDQVFIEAKKRGLQLVMPLFDGCILFCPNDRIEDIDLFSKNGRVDAIDLVQRSSNFEPSSRFFGRLKILNSKRRRNEAFEFDLNCEALPPHGKSTWVSCNHSIFEIPPKTKTQNENPSW